MANAESIPIKDSSRNYVYYTNVINHVEHRDKVLAECRRIAKVTGEVCFAVQIVNFSFSLLGSGAY
ncbi:MAG: class I SAM-dependent methyltransferase [Syntrophales bacterium]